MAATPQLRTAGPGGHETEACVQFGDSIYEIMTLAGAIVKSQTKLKEAGVEMIPELFGQALFDMCLCKAIDSSLTYITDSLRAIYRTKPDALRSSEKIDVNFIMEHSSMDELIAAILERRVYELSYKSIDDLSGELSKKLGVGLFFDDPQKAEAVRLVGIRNLLVHNRGIVNEKFKRDNPKSIEKVGNSVRLAAKENSAAMIFLVSWIADLDVRLIEKFGLPTVPRVPRPWKEKFGQIE
jgi:uncharacterized protein YutE (UPF0331/DUF86 family)